MTNKKSKHSSQEDPLAELNTLNKDNAKPLKVETIETEKDPLYIMEQKNQDKLPDYDSKSHSIVKNADKKDDINSDTEIKYEKEDKINNILLDAIDEIAVGDSPQEAKNASEGAQEEAEILEKVLSGSEDEIVVDVKRKDPKSFKIDVKDVEPENLNSRMENLDSELENLDLKSKVEAKAEKKVETKSDVKASKDSTDKSDKAETKIIDEVKVDGDGVPLLNQLDMDKLKNSSIVKNTKHNLSKIVGVVVGLCVMAFGIIQAFNDTIKISDSVMYGEHETIAIAMIFIGVLIVLLSFYKEIMSYFSFAETGDDDITESGSIDDFNEDKK
ncbi:MAG: hypothetical protein SOZ23_06045 [Methanosphaera sp.]|uniref:hypothetical protein n=1 Tax=Methanosphaera sp. TaxID=2666342 RepID=UPI0025D2C9A3|nr:hypothetical protein [Methanosphaera sp.]MCI5866774.1 hypothetical protein [Methanosphaera sp.]MDD6534288.1 hypothetical protein [Methanosphaera sp.]MDY3956327.1 hypothetical protein [Methanosphaera sp.]